MIKVNLLPFRAERKRVNIKKQIALYIACVIVLLLGMTYFWFDTSKDLAALELQKQELNADLKRLRATIKKIDALDKKTKELQAKLDVIKDLEKRKTGPVLLLDEIANAVPKGKLYLQSMKESKGILTLNGTAMDNETVALFMTNLERSDHIKTVDLNSAKMRSLSEFKLTVSDFSLKCKTYDFKEKKKKTDNEKKKTRRG